MYHCKNVYNVSVYNNILNSLNEFALVKVVFMDEDRNTYLQTLDKNLDGNLDYEIP